MATSTELINELVALTRGALRNLENDVSELRADMRVQAEKLKNKDANLERLEKHLDSVKSELEKVIEQLKNDTGSNLDAAKSDVIAKMLEQKSALEQQISALKELNTGDVEELKKSLKSKEEDYKALAAKVELLEKAHAKYLGIATGVTLLLGFIINVLPKLVGWV